MVRPRVFSTLRQNKAEQVACEIIQYTNQVLIISPKFAHSSVTFSGIFLTRLYKTRLVEVKYCQSSHCDSDTRPMGLKLDTKT